MFLCLKYRSACTQPNYLQGNKNSLKVHSRFGKKLLRPIGTLSSITCVRKKNMRRLGNERAFAEKLTTGQNGMLLGGPKGIIFCIHGQSTCVHGYRMVAAAFWI